MSTVLTSPTISGINKLFEIYLLLDDRDFSITTIDLFYEFLQRNTVARQTFLDDHCDYDFMTIDNVVVLRLNPKQ